MAKIIEFPEPRGKDFCSGKNKEIFTEEGRLNSDMPDIAGYAEMSTREKRLVLINKFLWVVEKLYALKQNDPHAVMPEDVRIRSAELGESTPEFFRDKILEADDNLINSHAAFYEALTDGIISKRLNRSKDWF